jgi:DNA-binding HxlR family transcriptional regulator
MALLDLLGRRWALRIIWELRGSGVSNFRELQDRCDHASSSVLNQRLHELRAAVIITYRDGGGYRLTADGERLLETLGPLETWADAWAARLETT